MSTEETQTAIQYYTITPRSYDRIAYARHIIVIGQTGHGKTSFVNAFFNFSYDRDPENFIYISNFSQDNFRNFGENTIESANNLYLTNEREEFLKRYNFGDGLTEHCYKYTCKNEFTIFDTPGLSDGRGFEQDYKNIENILKEASNSGYLNAIIYIINSSTSRLDPAIKNSINRLSIIIPKQFEKSVLLVHTFCRDGRSNFKSSWLPFTPRKEFFIDTGLFMYSKNELYENMKKMQKTWGKCKNVLIQLKTEIDFMNSEGVEVYKILYKEHNRVKSHYIELKLDLKALLKLKKALIHTKKLYLAYQTFYKNSDICVTEMIATEYFNTLCMFCNSVCHENCQLTLIAKKGSIKFKKCSCFQKSKTCKCCSHNYKQHYHEYKIPVKLMKNIKQMLKEFRGAPETQELPQEIEMNEYDRVRFEVKQIEDDIKKVVEEIEKKKSDLLTTTIMISAVCQKFKMGKQILLEIEFTKNEIDASENKDVEEISELEEWMELLKSLYSMIIEKCPREISID